MKRHSLYIIDDQELELIADLCEGLAVAIGRIIQRRRLARPELRSSSAVTGFQDLVQKAMLDDEEDPLTRLF